MILCPGRLRPACIPASRSPGLSATGLMSFEHLLKFGTGDGARLRLARHLKDLFQHPPVIGSIAMLWGYATSALRGLPRYDDPAFREFLREYQHACLRQGKKAATAALNARQEPVWRAAHPASSGGDHGSR